MAIRILTDFQGILFFYIVPLQDPHGKVPFFWGIAADGTVAFSDDSKLLKQGCGKSFAPFPHGISRSMATYCC